MRKSPATEVETAYGNRRWFVHSQEGVERKKSKTWMFSFAPFSPLLHLLLREKENSKVAVTLRRQLLCPLDLPTLSLLSPRLPNRTSSKFGMKSFVICVPLGSSKIPPSQIPRGGLIHTKHLRGWSVRRHRQRGEGAADCLQGKERCFEKVLWMEMIFYKIILLKIIPIPHKHT